jgi:hypothetical protein
MKQPVDMVVLPAGELSETVPAMVLPGHLKHEMFCDEPPGYFALYDYSDYDEEDLAVFDARDVIVWGLEFPDLAVSVLRNAYTGETELRLHETARAACEFFSTRAPLTLRFLPR